MTDSVRAWLNAAGRVPLLTPAEELHLGAMIRRWQDWPGGPDAAPAPVRRRKQEFTEQMQQSFVEKDCPEGVMGKISFPRRQVWL